MSKDKSTYGYYAMAGHVRGLYIASISVETQRCEAPGLCPPAGAREGACMVGTA